MRDVTDHPGYFLRDLLYRERQKRDVKTGCSFLYANGSIAKAQANLYYYKSGSPLLYNYESWLSHISPRVWAIRQYLMAHCLGLSQMGLAGATTMGKPISL